MRSPAIGLDNPYANLARLREVFKLDGRECGALARSPARDAILAASRSGLLDVAGSLLVEAGVIGLARLVAAIEAHGTDAA